MLLEFQNFNDGRIRWKKGGDYSCNNLSVGWFVGMESVKCLSIRTNHGNVSSKWNRRISVHSSVEPGPKVCS